MKRTITIFLGVFLILLVSSCVDSPKVKKFKVQFNPSVTAFTSGVVPRESSVFIQFSKPVPGVEAGREADPSILKISPNVMGELVWTDRQTLSFMPKSWLPSGNDFKVKIKLKKVFPDADGVFEFVFSTIAQSYKIDLSEPEPIDMLDLTANMVKGQVVMADAIENATVETIVKASQEGDPLEIEWEHLAGSNRHNFQIKGVVRAEKKSKVLVEWSGKAVDVDKEGQQELEVPSLNNFVIMDVQVFQHPSQSIKITFSDPLSPSQDLQGMFDLSGVSRLKYTVDKNVVVLSTNRLLDGYRTLIVSSGIKNTLNYEYEGGERFELAFESPKPAVEMLGKGTILPKSNGLTVPFKAVSLTAVEVRVIKIFENNIAQFLQVNQLNGSNQLKRAGRLITKRTIRLDTDKSLNVGEWNTYSLDLTSLINVDPGAIYRIELGFDRRHSAYGCEDEIEDVVYSDEVTETDLIYWDNPNSYQQSYWDGYYGNDDWRDSENPCSNAYYRKSRWVSRNLLASDLGIIAKRGNSKEVFVTVSDLTTTNPMAKVKVEIYNYQNEIVGEAITDVRGMVRVPVSSKPFLLVAKDRNQRGYLRMDDGSSLSLSHFDVGGLRSSHGLKGFIYGERGVWRPEDTLFLSFILEDKEKVLPENHPVILELSNPHGKLVTRQLAKNGINGVYTFSLSTKSDAPTGYWLCKVLVGGTAFEKPLKIETVKPNRLKIELKFDKEVLSAADTDLKGTISSKWLHGAVARNLKANVSVTLNKTRTSFKRYSNYIFDDPTRDYAPSEMTVFDGRLNASGEASVSADISVNESAPGMLKAAFRTRVFEESGDFSVDGFSVPFSPYENYVGISVPKGDRRGMLLTDTLHTIEVVTLDINGNPVNCTDLKYTVYKVNWRWWWEKTVEDLGRYIRSYSNQGVVHGTLSTVNGKGSFSFKVQYPAWGRYLIHVEDARGGHATGKTVYVDWPGWAMKPREGQGSGASTLNFNTDKDKYRTGQMATISFPSSVNGRALVTVENGSKVLDGWWVETHKDMTNYSFSITPEMAPNAYVHVSLLQPHGQTNNDLPIRMYGVVPLYVEDPDTHIKPVLKMPDELQPESRVEIKVSEVNGQPMTYTLAMVDEGLLDLTRYTTPTPWNHFYAREALGVKTWDMYNWVVGAFGGQIEKVFGIGGDGEMGREKGGEKVNRFKPMVRFVGPFKLESGEVNKHQLQIPRYVGSVKTMVVARREEAYGQTQKVTPVRKPLMVLATLPRVLGPGEKVALPVSVFAMKEGLKNVTVKVETNGLLKLAGEPIRKLVFKEVGDQVVDFNLVVAGNVGKAKVKVIVSSGSERSVDEIDIEVRNPNPPVFTYIDRILKAGEKAEINYQFPGMEGTNSGIVEVSSIPPVDFGRRLKYLLRYPHGCVEQITSAAFPQLFLSNVMEVDDRMAAEIDRNVKVAINKLSGFITADGGLSYWPRESTPSDWGSTYGGHFLFEAEKKGYALPVNFKLNWIKYQQRRAREWSSTGTSGGDYSSDFHQAYRLYTLALVGKTEMGAMNRLRSAANLSNMARWRLAGAFALAGQTEAAEELIVSAKMDVSDQQYAAQTYGSAARDRAMIVEVLSIMKRHEVAAPLVKQLSKSLSSEQWMSTQTTAYCLVAMSRFAGDNQTSSKLVFSIFGDGVKQEKVTSEKPITQIPVEVNEVKDGQLTVSNGGTGILYVRVITEGVPAVGDSKSIAKNLSLSVSYYNLDGVRLDDVSSLESGTDFVVKVLIQNRSGGLIKDMALSQIFPSGWEIRNTRLENIQSGSEEDIPTYRDIRDDRVYTYFDLAKGSSKTFVVVLNAAYKGKYYLPSVSCEAMYDYHIQARQPGQWVQVIAPEGMVGTP